MPGKQTNSDFRITRAELSQRRRREGARMRAFAWSSSPVGPAASWPQSLKTAVSICITSRYPIVIWWWFAEMDGTRATCIPAIARLAGR